MTILILNSVIGMPFEEFAKLIREKPNDLGVEYVPIFEHRGQNQHCYVFEKVGLMVWVWREKIRTVIVSNYDEE